MEMDIEQILEEIHRKPVVPLWPHAGKALGVSRGAIYAAAARNEIEVIRIGRSIKAVSAALRKQLRIDAEA
jgi:hypothetical protein